MIEEYIKAYKDKESIEDAAKKESLEMSKYIDKYETEITKKIVGYFNTIYGEDKYFLFTYWNHKKSRLEIECSEIKYNCIGKSYIGKDYMNSNKYIISFKDLDSLDENNFTKIKFDSFKKGEIV